MTIPWIVGFPLGPREEKLVNSDTIKLKNTILQRQEYCSLETTTLQQYSAVAGSEYDSVYFNQVWEKQTVCIHTSMTKTTILILFIPKKAMNNMLT